MTVGESGPMRIVIAGLTITSSWGNGHATTYRALVRELAARGHDVLFLEHDKPWYAEHRDLPCPPYGRSALYGSVDELVATYAAAVRDADAVIVGSYVPQGVEVGRWVTETARGVTAFYDIDTPVTLARLARDDCDYVSADLIRRYAMYLSFSGGPTLRRLESEFGSPRALPLYCSVDPALYFSEKLAVRWDMGYLGTYSPDRQPSLDALMLAPAKRWPAGRFVVAGPQYPDMDFGDNVDRIEHLPPARHRGVLQRAGVHAEHHAGGHDRRRLQPQRAAVRGGGVRRADRQRLVGRARHVLHAGRGRPDRARRRRYAALPTRHFGGETFGDR